MKWSGVQTMTGGGFNIVAHVVGKGVEGEVKGMRAKWTYKMDFDGTPETLIYYADGFLFKGKQGTKHNPRHKRRHHKR
jgi:hypothetical protein